MVYREKTVLSVLNAKETHLRETRNDNDFGISRRMHPSFG